MNPRGNPSTLLEARRRDSLDKRARVLSAITALEREGRPITFVTVARTAGVSTWLTYAPGIRDHIEAARTRQQRLATADQPPGTPATPLTLRAEAEAARSELRQLREERDRLRDALRLQLGQQLDSLAGPDLAARADELSARNNQLTDQLQHAEGQNTALRARITELEEDLAAARTSLRRMIQEKNRA